MLQALLDVFFPDCCVGCGNVLPTQLTHICTECRLKLPRLPLDFSGGAVEKIFRGRVNFNKAYAFLQFNRGSRVQNLMHHFKYKGVKEVGVTVGQMCGHELQKAGFFQDIDFIVPIPIHKKKEAIRGYNQSFYWAEGLSNITELPVLKEVLIKVEHTTSQTRKNRYQRWQNVASTFAVQQAEVIRDKHILLVDDVVTTGSTIESASIHLQKAGIGALSLLCMAMANY
jgi:ComF family protein